MKLTLRQTNQLIRESIERFNKADRKMSLLSERKITIEKLLISEGFKVVGVLNYHDDDLISDIEGELARRIHAAVPKSRKVFPPTNAANGFNDNHLAAYDLRFDEDADDGLITRSNLTKMSGVDTGFPIFAAYSTTKPGIDTPPCVEMLLNAIKHKNSKSPYRIDEEQIGLYEESAADRIATIVTTNIDSTLMDMNPIFVVIACPSHVRHTQNLAKMIENKLSSGKTARNNPKIFTRQPRKSASFINLLKKVTYREAANAIGDLNNSNCIRFLPDLRVERRHTALHEMWTNYVLPSRRIMDVFYTLSKKPNAGWLVSTVRIATSEDELGGAFDQIHFMIESLLDDYMQGEDEDLSSKIVEELFNNPDESALASRIFDNKDPRIPSLILLLKASGDKQAMTKVYKTAEAQYQAAIRRLITAELDTRPVDQGTERLSESSVGRTYSMNFNDWTKQQQEKIDDQIIKGANERPNDAFSISKISALSGNRKHVSGFIVDNPEHDEAEVIQQVQSTNTTNRPYILVVVDDNVETGTTMREVARRAQASMQELTGNVGFSTVIGATALAIRGPTVRCSSIMEEPYSLPETEI
jgi:hypothetical protein